MKHIILGTAGHVDHGKTSLVKALTGIDCDTHKEEKRRGITINLGFAHCTLPDGNVIGIVDVPGHRDFIHTMVSGASGIDLALLVVAADGGVMPQTREHVRIMQLLGIQGGIIALTRIDVADPDMVSLAVEELGSFTRGTFLECCPIVKVSAVTGEGINELKKTITEAVSAASDRRLGEGFRMYIDRIFSVAGFGTVVTGSVQSGSLKNGSTAYLMPIGRELRVRRLERYGREVEEVCAGDRASLNLVGLSREEFVRGMMVSDRLLRTTTLVDARLELFDEARELSLWSQEMFLMGTYEAQVKVHLIDRNTLAPGSSGVVQIHLPHPCCAQFGDRFVLRESSGEITIGGGEIIDFSPLHHRRRPENLVERLSQLAKGSRGDFIAEGIRKYNAPISLSRLSEQLNCNAEEIVTALPTLPPDVYTIQSSEKIYFFMTRENLSEMKRRCIGALQSFHRDNPLLAEGKTVEDFCGMLFQALDSESMILTRAILDQMNSAGEVKTVGNTWALPHHSVTLSSVDKKQADFVEEFLFKCDMQVPLTAELEAASQKVGIDKKELKQLLTYLTRQGRVFSIEESYIHASIVLKAKKMLVEKLSTTPEGLTVAQFRDLIGANRKMCLALFAHFDATGITERQGDVRILKGK